MNLPHSKLPCCYSQGHYEFKRKITLTKEQETLLIPLYAKAQDNPLYVDQKAARSWKACSTISSSSRSLKRRR